MEFFQSKVFWGLVVILIGLSIVLDALFKINLPVFKLIIALLFIFLGVKMLSGTFFSKSSGPASVFSENRTKVEHPEDLNAEYTVIFGSQTIDLTDFKPQGDQSSIEVNIVFGAAKIYIAPHQRIQMQVNNVLGASHSPEDAQKDNDEPSDHILIIKGNVVFGELKVKRR